MNYFCRLEIIKRHLKVRCANIQINYQKQSILKKQMIMTKNQVMIRILFYIKQSTLIRFKLILKIRLILSWILMFTNKMKI